MGQLPSQLASGPVLESYHSLNPNWGTLHNVSRGSSRACGPFASSFRRGNAGMNGAAVLTFSEPVSHFYIATLHDQGSVDEITVTGGQVVLNTPVCATGSGSLMPVDSITR